MSVATSALSASAAAHEPSWVREGSKAVQGAYKEGVGFEEMLLERLTQSLADTAGLGESGAGEAEEASGVEEESGGGEAALGSGGSGLISSVLPQALTESVISSGGLGLADEMAHQLGEGAR